MANLIDMGLDDAKLLEKSGFLDAIKSGRKVVELLKKRIFETRKTNRARRDILIDLTLNPNSNKENV